MGITNSLCKEKKDKTQVCSDFSTSLNEYLLTYNYSLPSLEGIFVEVNGEKFFKVELVEGIFTVTCWGGMFEMINYKFS